MNQYHSDKPIDGTRVPFQATIDGPHAGGVEQTYPFTLTVTSFITDPKTPLIYTWYADGDPAMQAPSVNTTYSLSTTIGMSWDQPGTHTITATARHATGTITATKRVTISIPPNNLRISGPLTGTTGADYDFVAMVSPGDATTPITYSWKVHSDQSLQRQFVTTRTASLSDTFRMVWETSGVQVITLTAANPGGAVHTSHALFLRKPAPDGALQHITPEQGGILVTTDGNIQIHFPPGAVTEDAIAIFTRLDQLEDGQALRSGLGILQLFRLELYALDGTPIERLERSAEMTVYYTEEEWYTCCTSYPVPSMRFWAGRTWLVLPSDVDTQHMRVDNMRIGRATDFALVGQLQFDVFVPLIWR
ncbi:MAG: hypothetical protein HC837_19900 [Chloroflexaceae bacterium]|nr:hypothetical protein [Chloroflexaceae bacterium]